MPEGRTADDSRHPALIEHPMQRRNLRQRGRDKEAKESHAPPFSDLAIHRKAASIAHLPPGSMILSSLNLIFPTHSIFTQAQYKSIAGSLIIMEESPPVETLTFFIRSNELE